MRVLKDDEQIRESDLFYFEHQPGDLREVLRFDVKRTPGQVHRQRSMFMSKGASKIIFVREEKTP